MSRMLVPIADLRLELAARHRELAELAERWVTARAGGKPTSALDERMRLVETDTRRLERRINRRTRTES